VVSARGRTSGRLASATLTVASSTATLTLAPATASQGSVITATASGFAPGESVAFAGLGFVGSVTADSNGVASSSNTLNGNVPDSSYLIEATGRTTGMVATANVQVIEPGEGTMTLSPASTPAGRSVSVSTSGFQAGESVTVYGPASTSLATADDTGQVTCTIPVDQSTRLGFYLVSAAGVRSGRLTTSTLTVTASNAAVTVSPIAASAGSSITIAGTGFQPGEKVAVSGPRVSTSAVADTSGAFSLPATLIGTLPDATYTVEAVGTTSRLEVTTTIAVSGGSQHGTLTLSTSPSVQAGAAYSATIGGLSAGESFTVFVPSGVPVKGTADASGNASLSLTMPYQQTPGSYPVQVNAGLDSATSVIAVTRPQQVVSTPNTAQAAGSTVQVSGHGFASGETVSVSGFWAAPVQASADTTGSFSTNVTLGKGIPTGALSVVASGETSRWAANDRLKVTAAHGPSIVANAASVSAGSIAGYSLSGFAGDASVSVSVQGVNAGSVAVTVDSRGNGTASIPIAPVTVTGNYLVSATDAGTRVYAVQGVNGMKPSIKTSTTTALAGSSITVTGTGFQAGETVSLVSPGNGGSATADSTGSWTATIVTLPWLPGGNINLGAFGKTSKLRTTRLQAMSARQPTLTVSPTSANLGALIQLSGSGMMAGDNILLTGPFVTLTMTADSTGAFSTSAQVGSVYVPGPYGLAALDLVGGLSADTELTVTQTQ
jgi:hypothetical protein